MSNGKWYSNPLPLLILLLFGGAHFIYVYFFCLDVVKHCGQRIAFLVVSNFLGILLVWSFLATMCSRVGEVPVEFKFTRNQHNALIGAHTDDEKDDILEKFCERNGLLLQTCTSSGSIRYCTNCMHIKPDRAHHCPTCQKCVLKMDHHCPWVNNCIGFHNYKSFILLIFYTCLYCLFYSATTMRHIIYFMDRRARLEKDVPISVGFGFAIILGLVTLGFLGYHLFLASRNETTLENVHPPNFAEDDLTFDLGFCQNMVELFGTRCYLWLVPVFSSLGDGYTFLVESRY